MVMTPSTMLPLGTQAPDFALPDTDGNTVALSDLADAKSLLVMFICNHCPFVIHVADELARLAKDYQPQGIVVIAVSANDIATHPADSPEAMKEEKAKRGYPFPYLYDETQSVAKAYTAACTPDFFLFDGNQKLVYRGQLDDSRPNRISSGNYDSSKDRANGADLRAAIDAVLAGQAVHEDQKPSIGCNIKWIPGNEPAYFAG